MSHQLPIRVYYEDTDAGGIVYHSTFLNFAERARTEWLRELGIHQSQMTESEGVIFVVRRCEVDYLAPGKLDDALIVETRLKQLGNASITMRQDVIRPSDEVTLAALEVVCVCVNQQMRPTRLPNHIRQLLTTE